MKPTEEAKCMINTCAAFSSTWITVCLGVRVLSFWVALGSPIIHILSWCFSCPGRNLKMGCCHHLWGGAGHVQGQCLGNSELYKTWAVEHPRVLSQLGTLPPVNASDLGGGASSNFKASSTLPEQLTCCFLGRWGHSDNLWLKQRFCYEQVSQTEWKLILNTKMLILEVEKNLNSFFGQYFAQ